MKCSFFLKPFVRCMLVMWVTWRYNKRPLLIYVRVILKVDGSIQMITMVYYYSFWLKL